MFSNPSQQFFPSLLKYKLQVLQVPYENSFLTEDCYIIIFLSYKVLQVNFRVSLILYADKIQN